MSLWKQTGEQPQLLAEAPELPVLAAHLWRWFLDLNSTERMDGGMSPGRITSGILRDWCWATGNNPALWERLALRRLDSLWIRLHQNGS